MVCYINNKNINNKIRTRIIKGYRYSLEDKEVHTLKSGSSPSMLFALSLTYLN